MNKKSQSGQGLLIVIMLMVVGLTVGLAVVSRSFVTQKNTTNETESQKAYSAAEAGIEKQLGAGCSGSCVTDLGNGSSINNVDVAPISIDTSGSFLINGTGKLFEDNGGDVWFACHNINGTIEYSTSDPNCARWSGNMQISWGTTSPPSNACSSAAMEVIVVYASDEKNVWTKTYGFDSCNNRSGSNGLTYISGGPPYKTQLINIAAGSNPLFARVIPLYYDASNVKVSNSSPPININQGETITSTGLSGSTQRTVQVTRQYSSLPSEYFYSLLIP